jgi:hypothetical protein
MIREMTWDDLCGWLARMALDSEYRALRAKGTDHALAWSAVYAPRD